MLVITTKSRKIEWHVGEPLPTLELGSQLADTPGDGRVIRFQADGHELSWLLEGMRLREAYPFYPVREELP